MKKPERDSINERLTELWDYEKFGTPFKQGGRYFFTRNDDRGYSYVHKQPETDDDRDLCMEALEGCPVEAIGEDGKE